MAKKKTQGVINRERYLAEGKLIPTCVNQGCDNNVVVRDWKYYSFKHMCSDCSLRLQKNLDPRPGVKFYKKNHCENTDGRLGFKCPVRPDWKFPNSVLHGDHINGDHEDNRPENLQTLCSICHHLKGMQSGDFNSAVKGRKLS